MHAPQQQGWYVGPYAYATHTEHMGYAYPMHEPFGYSLDTEDRLRDQLYQAPQKPKGNTSNRYRGKDYRWAR